MLTRQDVINNALNDALPCKCCKRKPRITAFSGDLFYAQCDCKKWEEFPYMFCGTTVKGAVAHWNLYQKKGPASEEFY